jgi:hypothetical protein
MTFKTEHDLQVAVVIMLREEVPREICWYAVPNGEWRDPATARKLKDAGVRPGVADLIFQGHGVSLAIELKKPLGGRQSPDQRGFQEIWTGAGGVYEIARSVTEVRVILKRHGMI